MEINKNLENGCLTLSLVGELNSETARMLEQEVKTSLNGISSLIFDMKDLVYLTSAGLRILLVAQKIMNSQGNMKLINVNEDVKEILFLTGFNNVLEIED